MDDSVEDFIEHFAGTFDVTFDTFDETFDTFDGKFEGLDGTFSRRFH